MEDKKIHDEDMGQEIEFEEEEDIKLDEEFKESPRVAVNRGKLMVVIVSIVVVFFLIIGGWIYFFKMNLEKINIDFQSQSTTVSENVSNRLKDTYNQLRDMIREIKDSVSNVTPESYTKPQDLGEKLEHLTEEK